MLSLPDDDIQAKYLAAAFFVGAALTLVAHTLAVSAANGGGVCICDDVGVDALVCGRGAIATLSAPSLVADAIVALACSVHCNNISIVTKLLFVTSVKFWEVKILNA